jgi:putative FmdB family regulatory protein
MNNNLSAKMIACKYTVKKLLHKLDVVEANMQITAEEKLDQIKKISDEISKVSVEIDSIKKEIKLIDRLNINWEQMPTYLYSCEIHGEFEHQHSIKEELEFCPKCQAENVLEPQRVKKLIASGGNFILTGSGWAKDSYS